MRGRVPGKTEITLENLEAIIGEREENCIKDPRPPRVKIPSQAQDPEYHARPHKGGTTRGHTRVAQRVHSLYSRARKVEKQLAAGQLFSVTCA